MFEVLAIYAIFYLVVIAMGLLIGGSLFLIANSKCCLEK